MKMFPPPASQRYSNGMSTDSSVLSDAIDVIYWRVMAEELGAVVLLDSPEGMPGGFVVVPAGATQAMQVVGGLAAACMQATPERRSEILDAVAMVLFDPQPASDEISAPTSGRS